MKTIVKTGMGLLHELEAASRLLEAARKSQSQEQLNTLTLNQVRRLAALTGSADLGAEAELAAFLEALDRSPFAPDQRKELADAALNAPSIPMREKGAVKTYRMQSCLSFQNYLTEENWIDMRNGQLTMEHKIMLMVKRCVEVGLETPTEATHVHLLAVVIALDGSSFNADTALKWLDTQKHQLKKLRSTLTAPSLHDKFPEHWAEFLETDPPCKVSASPAAAQPPNFDKNIKRLATMLPARKTHRSVTQQSVDPGLLRSTMNRATPQSAAEKSMQALLSSGQAHHQMLQIKCPAPHNGALSVGIGALTNASDSPSGESEAGRGSFSWPQAHHQLALPSETLFDSQTQQPPPSLPQPQPTLPLGGKGLENIVQQLQAARDATKTGSGSPGVPSTTKAKSNTKSKTKAEAKAKSAAKANPKALHKAKASPKAMPKGKAKAKASPKAPPKAQGVPMAAANPGKKPYVDKFGKPINDQVRHHMFPEGCLKCRQVAGCTPSCWKKRRVE